MVKRIQSRGSEIRRFVLENLASHSRDIVRLTAKRFGITRQAAIKHLNHLIDEGAIVADGVTSDRSYRLAPQLAKTFVYPITADVTEDRVWLDVAPVLSDLPENVIEIWQYGFTEMFNNVIDHATAKEARVEVRRDPAQSEVLIYDDGIGIFRKITQALGLLDERHAVLELAKGKFTTDPARHTGEGIFFSSRAFDEFAILSGGVYFSHEQTKEDDWILESKSAENGTLVVMRLDNNTSRRLKDIFAKYESPGNYGFTKTVVPVRLAQYGDAALISRSQAKRLLARVDRFHTVILDFREVHSIGHSFADEIFRVFASQHPQVRLGEVNANDEVSAMIQRARATPTSAA